LERRELLSVGATPVASLEPALGLLAAVSSAKAAPKAAATAKVAAAATTIKLFADGSGSQAGLIEKAAASDMYRFVAPVSGTMTIRQSAASKSNVDCVLSIYDSKQKLLANDDSPGSLNSQVSLSVTKGATYFVKAAAFRKTFGNYNLTFTTVPDTPDDFADSFDIKPGDKNDMALSNKGAGGWSGKVNYLGDEDMFRFMTTVPGEYVVRLAAATGSKLDPYLYLYDGDHRLIASNNNFGTSKSSRVEMDVSAGGVYYLMAKGTAGTTGAYTVQITSTPVPEDDFANTIADATADATAIGRSTIGLSADGFATQAGRVELAGDVDMFIINVPVDGRMKLQESAAPGSNLSPEFTLYNATGQPLGTYQGGEGTFALLDRAVNGGETYYVGVTGQAVSAGTYSVQVSIYVPPPPPPPPDNTYNITLNMNISDPALQAEVQRAAQKWEQVITCDLPAVFYQGQWIDDIVMDVTVTPLGPGTLGRSFMPLFRPRAGNRLGSGLPYYNEIELNSSAFSTQDVQSGFFFTVALHEMAHAIGFSWLWDRLGLVTGMYTNNPRYTGRNAVSEYQRVYNTTITTVPVEGFIYGVWRPGSSGGHWRRSTFVDEVMTYAGDSTAQAWPLSSITVASFIDVGYTVNMAAADAFVPPAPASLTAIDTLMSALAQTKKKLLLL
jgi:hypothetical protein